MLRKCKICKYVYLPSARFNHCPVCGTFTTNGKAYDLNTNRIIKASKHVGRTIEAK